MVARPMDIRDENPYRSPQVTDDLPVGLPTVSVAGNMLLAPSGTVLPPICVRSGKPVEIASMVQHSLPSHLSFTLSKTCILTYGLHPAIRRQAYRRSMFVALVAISSIALGLVWLVDLPLVLLMLFVLVAVLWFKDSSALYVVGYQNGIFRIKGCSPAFLQQLEHVLNNSGNDSSAAASGPLGPKRH